jgi:translation initiation factor IF-3
VFVIDEEGTNLGEMPTKEALNLAVERGLDLVEINPTHRPPICKIMDFGRYKYDMAKKEKESKAKRKETGLKEVRLTFKIGDHDIEYKAKQAKEFLDAGNKVKVSMRLRGRENAFAEVALGVFEKFAMKAGLEYENKPQRAGNQITAMLTAPKTEKITTTEG